MLLPEQEQQVLPLMEDRLHMQLSPSIKQQ
jgi:hypothetical protein